MSYWIIGITTVVSLAGTAVSYVGQQQAAQAAEDTAAFNATQNRLSARQAEEAAAENARRKEQETARLLASIRAGLAANGLAMEGTPLAVLGDEAAAGALAVADIGYEAANRSRSLMANAAIGMFEGQSTAQSLRTQSYGTAISDVSSAAYGYAKGTGMIGSTGGGTGYLG